MVCEWTGLLVALTIFQSQKLVKLDGLIYEHDYV